MNSVSNAEQALDILKSGNQRFAEDSTESPNRNAQRRVQTAENGQSPYAAVVACSDSRVPVSTLFDAGVGDIFTIRLAGNVIGESALGSIEYAVKHLGIKLLVILGHSSCGAVQATISGVQDSESINFLIEKIKPAIDKINAQSIDPSQTNPCDAVARENVLLQIQDLLRRSQIVSNAHNQNTLRVMGAFYDISTGKIEWME